MNILEEFWYGNIEPAEYDISSSKEYKELLQLISRNEDKLLATMTENQKELFTKYTSFHEFLICVLFVTCPRRIGIASSWCICKNSSNLTIYILTDIVGDKWY